MGELAGGRVLAGVQIRDNKGGGGYKMYQSTFSQSKTSSEENLEENNMALNVFQVNYVFFKKKKKAIWFTCNHELSSLSEFPFSAESLKNTVYCFEIVLCVRLTNVIIVMPLIQPSAV